jgi:hypothetical protein
VHVQDCRSVFLQPKKEGQKVKQCAKRIPSNADIDFLRPAPADECIILRDIGSMFPNKIANVFDRMLSQLPNVAHDSATAIGSPNKMENG